MTIQNKLISHIISVPEVGTPNAKGLGTDNVTAGDAIVVLGEKLSNAEKLKQYTQQSKRDHNRINGIPANTSGSVAEILEGSSLMAKALFDKYGVEFYQTDQSHFNEAGQMTIPEGTIPLEIVKDINRVSRVLYDQKAIEPCSWFMDKAWIKESLVQSRSLHLMIPKDSNTDHPKVVQLYKGNGESAHVFWGAVMFGFYRINNEFPINAKGRIDLDAIGSRGDRGDFGHGVYVRVNNGNGFSGVLKSHIGGVDDCTLGEPNNVFDLFSSNHKFE